MHHHMLRSNLILMRRHLGKYISIYNIYKCVYKYKMNILYINIYIYINYMLRCWFNSYDIWSLLHTTELYLYVLYFFICSWSTSTHSTIHRWTPIHLLSSTDVVSHCLVTVFLEGEFLTFQGNDLQLHRWRGDFFFYTRTVVGFSHDSQLCV